MKKMILLVVGLMLWTAGTASAGSWPITYQVSGTLTGEYAPTGDTTIPFSDIPFTFQVTADAVTVVPITTFNQDDLYVAGSHPLHQGPGLAGVLTLFDVGMTYTFTFEQSLYVADSQAANLQPGIFEIGTDVEGQFIDVQHLFFETYLMMTQVSPLSVELLQVGPGFFSVAETTGGTSGVLSLAAGSPLMTFQAEGGVPEPSTVVLLGAGAAGLLLRRRRR